MCFAFQGRGKYWGKLVVRAIIGYRAPNMCLKNTGTEENIQKKKDEKC